MEREDLVRLIDEYADIIDKNEFDKLYSCLQRKHSPEELGAISSAFVEADIDFMSYMKVVPTCCFYGSELAEVTVPDNINKIGKFSFAFSKIDKLKLPASIEEVCDHAFYGADIRIVEFNGSKDQMFELGAQFPKDTIVYTL